MATNRNRLLKATIVLAFIAASATFVWMQSRPQPGGAPPPLLSERPARPVIDLASAPPAPVASDAPAVELVPGPGQQLELNDPLNTARTPAELDWLRRNGFPSEAEKKAVPVNLPAVSRINIRDGATSSELIALSEIALADESSREAAIASLNEAAALGSMYALEVLGNLYNDPRIRNPVMSEAYLRASQYRGNWATAIRRHPAMPPERDVLASLMAQQFIENANILRAQRGMGPLQHDFRPGLGQAIHTIRNGIVQAGRSTSEGVSR
jgi:hypothetical protein